MKELKRVALSAIKGAMATYLIASVFLIIILAAFGVRDAYGAIEPFRMQEVSINYKDFFKNGHTPYLVNGSVPSKEINLNLNTDVFEYMYFNNMVWSLWDQHQVRWVGWNFHIGAYLTSFLDVEYEHFSRHILDTTYPYKDGGDRFPVEDSIGVKLYLWRPFTARSIF